MEIKNISTNTVSKLQELKGAELFVYSIIGGSKDNCVSLTAIGQMCGTGKAAVKKITDRLIAKGYLEQVNKGVSGIRGATYKLLKEDPFNFDWTIFMNLEGERLTKTLGRYFEMRVGKDKYGNGRYRCGKLDDAQLKLAEMGLIKIYEGDGQYHIFFIKEKKYMLESGDNIKEVKVEVKYKVDYKKLYEEKCAEAEELRDKGRRLKERAMDRIAELKAELESYKKLYEEKCAEAEELRDKGRRLKEHAMGKEKDLKDRIAELEAELESLKN